MFSFKKFLSEALDDRVDTHVRDFAGNIRNHPRFGKNSLTAIYGRDLIDNGYDEHETSRTAANVPDKGVDSFAFRALSQIMRMEGQHKEILERKAIELASKQMGFDASKLHAELKSSMSAGKYAKMQGKKKDVEPDKLAPADHEDVKHGIEKRMNLRLLSQGHALTSMDDLFTAENDALEKIDIRLPSLYKQLSIATKGTYYHTASVGIFASNPSMRADGSVGEVFIAKNPETNKMEIYASAITFPFLVQELIKGIMEYIARHGYKNMDKKVVNSIKHGTNFAEDEPYQFLMGPQLWKLLVKATPEEYRTKMQDVILQLSQMPPREFNAFMRNLADDMAGPEKESPRSAQIIHELMDDLKDRRNNAATSESED
jgi:hypothetical protein